MKNLSCFLLLMLMPVCANADNILLPISGTWIMKDGAQTGVLRISNGENVTPSGVRGQVAFEVKDGGGFVQVGFQGWYNFQQTSGNAGVLQLNFPNASVQVFEQEFGPNNNILTFTLQGNKFVFYKQ